jgi:hypothetical protein
MIAAGLLLVTVARSARAEDAVWNLEQLMRELAAVQESRARFVENRYLSLLKSPLQTEGTLHYAAPDRLEKYTLTPKPERMVIEAGRLTLENIARGTRRSIALPDYPVLWGFVESIRGTLSGDLAALQRFYHVDYGGSRTDWHLTLIPRDDKMKAAVDLIRIDGREHGIRSVEVRESKGDRSVMTITEEGG